MRALADNAGENISVQMLSRFFLLRLIDIRDIQYDRHGASIETFIKILFPDSYKMKRKFVAHFK
jgi:hypothetical protein